jgi:hypothetical protein
MAMLTITRIPSRSFTTSNSSSFFDCPSWGDGDSLDRERFEKRAAAKARELLAQESPPLLSVAQEAAIDDVVKEAAMDLKVEVPVWRRVVRG